MTLPPPSRRFGRIYACLMVIVLFSLAGCRAKKAAVGGGAHRPGISATMPSRVAAEAEGTLPEATRRLLAETDRWMGTPYRYGSKERGKGTDCSGFVMTAYLNALSLKLPRSSREQQQWCAPVKGGFREAIPGDLVFFTTGRKGRVSHVGIYLGAGRVVHASTSKGVIVSDLAEPYYTRTYHSTGRVPSYYAMLDTPAANPANPAPSDKSDKSEKASAKPAVKLAARPDTILSPDEARRLLLRRLAETDSATVKR